MFLKLYDDAQKESIELLLTALKAENLSFELIETAEYKLIHLPKINRDYDVQRFINDASVEKVIPIFSNMPQQKPLKANDPSKRFTSKIMDIMPLYIAGPCSVESEAQMHAIAKIIKASKAQVLRGGAFKPRTSPYSFQGLKESGLKILADTAKLHKLLSISEIVSENDIDLFIKHGIDIIQVGARNMQNFSLLKALGKIDKPILLKRGFVNTVEEWLMSAEYLLHHGNPNVILCERGIRTFEPSTRTTLDIGGALVAKSKTHLPVIFDPSHAAGDFRLVENLSLAGFAAGLDGFMVEVHQNPIKALSDGAQSLKPERYLTLMKKIKEHY